MFTYKFVGLSENDSPSPYYYGSLPAKPVAGHILVLDDTATRYVVIRIDGEGLVGENGYDNQKELAWAEIGAGKTVPTLTLQLLLEETRVQGRSFSYEEVKEYSQKNREIRLSATAT